MPIAVKDYTWRETEAEVHIVLPLKGVKASKADILSTHRYIKVNYPPYLFEVYLRADVIEEQCTARVGNGVVEFRLVKKDAVLWGKLSAPEAEEDKRVLAEKRVEAVEAVRKAAEEAAEVRAKKKQEEERFAVHEQIRLEQEERERIEREKQVERDRADRELQRWREEKKMKQAQEKEKEVQQQKKKVMTEEKAQQLKKSSTQDKVSTAAIWTTEESSKQQKKSPPPPRARGSIPVRFTPRAFPTAARESKAEEEQEWLAKQAAARRISRGHGDEDPNERNPEFLKDRGVNFFKAKNYEAAVNVFSEAILLNPSLPQLHSNRAASYLALGEMDKCISDCCRALELYYPVVPANHTARAKVFARRGSAYAQSGQLQLAVQDYEAAVRLLPGDAALKNDCSRLKQALEEADKQ